MVIYGILWWFVVIYGDLWWWMQIRVSNGNLSGGRPCWLAVFPFPAHPSQKPLLLLFFLKLCKLYTHIPINLSLLSFILKSTQYYNLFVISAPSSQKPLLLLLSPNNANFLLTSQLTSLFYLSSWNRPNIIIFWQLPHRLPTLATIATLSHFYLENVETF